MRRKIIIGNWKMNNGPAKARLLTRKVGKLLPSVVRDVVLCPPFVSIPTVEDVLPKGVKLGAQDAFYEDSGPFTGEVSPGMLRELKVSYCIIGHSERRSHFHETNADINKKLRVLLSYGITPVFCIGETLDERKSHLMENVIEHQLREGLKGLKKSDVQEMVIAYEPVWAIGTGLTATLAQAEEVHLFIRKVLGQLYDVQVSEGMRILYGGSVTPENASELLKSFQIDGVLVGGASLDAEKFVTICTS